MQRQLTGLQEKRDQAITPFRNARVSNKLLAENGPLVVHKGGTENQQGVTAGGNGALKLFNYRRAGTKVLPGDETFRSQTERRQEIAANPFLVRIAAENEEIVLVLGWFDHAWVLSGNLEVGLAQEII